MGEKRNNDRAPTNLQARLVSDRLNVACTVVDLSPTGARLEIEPGLFIPKSFILKMARDAKGRPVEVVWRNRTQVGVRF